MRTGPTNLETRKLVDDLRKLSKKNKATIWARIADDLSKPRRNKREVNVSTLNRYTKKGEIVVVPGKLLAQGNLDHELTVAAFQMSESAKAKVKHALPIRHLAEKYPTGKGVRIIG